MCKFQLKHGIGLHLFQRVLPPDSPLQFAGFSSFRKVVSCCPSESSHAALDLVDVSGFFPLSHLSLSSVHVQNPLQPSA